MALDPAEVFEIKQDLVAARAILAKLSADLLALSDITVERYSLDTGQGAQSARRHDIDKLLGARKTMRAEIRDLVARLRGGTVQVVPAF